MALETRASPVDQAHLPEAHLVRGEQVLLDHRGNVARLESVQIDRVFDRDDAHLFSLLVFSVDVFCHRHPLEAQPNSIPNTGTRRARLFARASSPLGRYPATQEGEPWARAKPFRSPLDHLGSFEAATGVP